jgi:protein involved in temperature-dependent protein secretion
MKAITTTYHGPTNTRGARISATDSDGNRVSVPYSHSGNEHDEAAMALCRKMGWHGRLIAGHTKQGRVYVWLTDEPTDVLAVDNP